MANLLGKFFTGRKISYLDREQRRQHQYFCLRCSPTSAQPLRLGPGLNTFGGSDTAFARNGVHLLYYHDGPDAPNDLWVYDFATAKPHQLTHSLLAGVKSDSMAEPFLVHYPSTDKKWTISAFVYVPFNAERNGKNAAVVMIHGGPTAQTINNFNRSVQYLANQGYFVICPELSRVYRLRKRIPGRGSF